MANDGHTRQPFLDDLTSDSEFTGTVLRYPVDSMLSLSGQFCALLNNEFGEGALQMIEPCIDGAPG